MVCQTEKNTAVTLSFLKDPFSISLINKRKILEKLIDLGEHLLKYFSYKELSAEPNA